MSTIFEDVQTAVRGATCWIAGQAADGANATIDFLTEGNDPYDILGDAREYWRRRVAEGRDAICSDGPTGGNVPDTPTGGPPFEGGQCPGDRYNFAGVASFAGGANGSIDQQFSLGGSVTNRLRGPVNLTAEFAADGRPEYVFTGSEPGDRQVVAGSPDQTHAGIVVNSVTNLENTPDNCGNPPPISGPGAPPDGPEDSPPVIWIFPRPDPDNPGVDLPPVNVYPPDVRVFPDGSISFCFGVSVGFLSAEVCWTPGLGDPYSNPEGPVDRCCPEPDTDPPEAPEAEEDPPEDNDGRILIGVICSCDRTLAEQSVATVRGNGDGPNIYLPSLAELRFAVKTPAGQAWTRPEKIQGTKEYIEAPEGVDAYSWAIDEWRGVPISVTPVYTREVNPNGPEI